MKLDKKGEYEYDISLIGKALSEEEAGLNLNNYGKYYIYKKVALNENQKHFISPIIFHDESTTQNKKPIEYKESISETFLKNPLLIILFITISYYIYPSLWKKDYFMALSEDYNQRDLIKHSNPKNPENIYDYINYRRGLYVSVRSNFS